MEQLASLLPFIAIALVFWLLLVRPASRRQKQQRAMQAALSAGDRVMLTSGLFGTLRSVGSGDRVHLEIAEGVVVEAARAAVARVDGSAAADEPRPQSPEQQPGHEHRPDGQAATEPGQD